jgi:diguanylate cyclase (GGDEF)-like protein/PAS domain S-box-containing protein
MSRAEPLRLLRICGVYFVLAVLAVRLTRYDGGVAFLWFATPYLIAEMSVVPRRYWPAQLAAAGFASMAATGLFGMGWPAALPMALANTIEATVCAYLLRRQARGEPLESLRWLLHFALIAGVAAPLASSIIAIGVAMALGYSVSSTMLHWIAGHALSNFTFLPIFTLLAQGELRSCTARLSGRQAEAAGLIALTIFTIVCSFGQGRAPLLFLPILPIILVTFRFGRAAAALAILSLALIGGWETIVGEGPIHLLGQSAGLRAQFFQFYLAMTVLTVWPVAADLQNRSRLHTKLRVSEAQYRLIAEHCSDILMKLTREGIIRYVSPSIRELGGYDPERLIGHYSGDLIAEEDREHVRKQHRRAMEQPERTHSFEYRALTAEGSRRWFESHVRAVVGSDGKIDETISIIRDISARKATESSLSEAARTDVLTGLPNRRAFRETVEARQRAGTDCLAVLDIDHFKRVNDRYGHGAGDAVLRTVASVARCAIRETDFMARLGGEEFAILLPDTTLEQAMAVCERLRTNVSQARTFGEGAVIGVTVSGGVARIGAEGLAAALRIADAALYSAKNGGRDQFAVAA